MTYSIAARDPQSGLLGIGIQSHFFAAASVAPFAEPGVGAISTQAFASRQYGPLGMQLLAAGMPSAAVLDALLRLDTNRELRQIGIVDAQGRSAAFTGTRCIQYASHCTTHGVSAQGNMLAAPHIPDAMVEAYCCATGDFAEKILAALDAAQAAGGDARGMQSAGLLVVGAARDGRPWNAVIHDERVDDSSAPLVELRRLVDLRRGYRNIGAILFDEGPLFSDVKQTDPGDIERALEDLRDGAKIIGDTHHEAMLWQAVIMARHNRPHEAAALMAPLLRRETKLAAFIEGLVASGTIERSTGELLLATRTGLS
jgi:uncharacterized Ntn-hydrolase superfamily protein